MTRVLMILGLGACTTVASTPTSDASQKKAPATQPQPMEQSMEKTDHRWKVYDGDLIILEVSDVPGAITSTAPPPPDGKPVMHPFLSARARSAQHEHALRQHLLASTSLEDFLERLRTAGFRVTAVP